MSCCLSNHYCQLLLLSLPFLFLPLFLFFKPFCIPFSSSHPQSLHVLQGPRLVPLSRTPPLPIPMHSCPSPSPWPSLSPAILAQGSVAPAVWAACFSAPSYTGPVLQRLLTKSSILLNCLLSEHQGHMELPWMLLQEFLL